MTRQQEKTTRCPMCREPSDVVPRAVCTVCHKASQKEPWCLRCVLGANRMVMCLWCVEPCHKECAVALPPSYKGLLEHVKMCPSCRKTRFAPVGGVLFSRLGIMSRLGPVAEDPPGLTIQESMSIHCGEGAIASLAKPKGSKQVLLVSRMTEQGMVGHASATDREDDEHVLAARIVTALLTPDDARHVKLSPQDSDFLKKFLKMMKS